MRLTPLSICVVSLTLAACDDKPPTPPSSQAPPVRRIESGSAPAPIDGRVDPPRVEPDRIDTRIDSGELRRPTTDPRAPLDQGAAESDRRLAASVEAAIDRTTGLSAEAGDIRVTAINGRVTLRGSVESADELDRIRRIASDIAGADRVDLDLTIRPR